MYFSSEKFLGAYSTMCVCVSTQSVRINLVEDIDTTDDVNKRNVDKFVDSSVCDDGLYYNCDLLGRDAVQFGRYKASYCSSLQCKVSDIFYSSCQSLGLCICPALIPSFTWSIYVTSSSRVVMEGDVPVPLVLHSCDKLCPAVFIISVSRSPSAVSFLWPLWDFLVYFAPMVQSHRARTVRTELQRT
jgi:hypothetical protein